LIAEQSHILEAQAMFKSSTSEKLGVVQQHRKFILFGGPALSLLFLLKQTQ